ncbi:hypothetical protein [Paraburkholderia sp. RAU2J]|uniref:hypothetical protein n=1 Tax=Paraburkholderia sp. RAU2J TaxID=1938810 RepID=UPI000EB1699B|nr:hypothetical protein [Paraburkholderia sp. RAU2J]
MPNLNDGIGDLKRLSVVLRSHETEQPVVPQNRRRKIVALIVAILLTWGVLHIVLSVILAPRSPH